MSAVSVNWSSAEVQAGQLSVGLEGELPKGWKKRFEATVGLLGHAGFEDVRLKKGTVRVGGVAPGQEEKLRHFLESIVEQVNAAAGEQDEPEKAGGEDERSGSPRDDGGPDREMTERFRAFAE